MVQLVKVPVIAIDGPAAVGKGTVAQIVAKRLGWNYLDSGSLYRCIGLQAMHLEFYSREMVIEVARNIQIELRGDQVFLAGQDVTTAIRTTEVDRITSIISQIPEVRLLLRPIQLAQRLSPGLVADGRDMCFVFDESCGFYLDATAEERARRCVNRNKLAGKGNTNLNEVRVALEERDLEDKTRKENPLQVHPKATYIETSTKNQQEVAEEIVKAYLAAA